MWRLVIFDKRLYLPLVQSLRRGLAHWCDRRLQDMIRLWQSSWDWTGRTLKALRFRSMIDDENNHSSKRATRVFDCTDLPSFAHASNYCGNFDEMAYPKISWLQMTLLIYWHCDAARRTEWSWNLWKGRNNGLVTHFLVFISASLSTDGGRRNESCKMVAISWIFLWHAVLDWLHAVLLRLLAVGFCWFLSAAKHVSQQSILTT